ncbi:IclR family transcriptional regulator [Desulfovermiculus halophilus]|jgi:DNA-binding IclR family transcriptional regulator|uniref:IclR family transcriptional regulator n=1 Tax=Desulfovermiculus halophilus TaxID=339722 RepID=UPI0004840077|nr:IclR family transcriptional regulator [Desulfovermiculus halophilus]
MPSGKEYYYIASLDKGLRVLELLAEGGAMHVSRIAAALGYNRASAHRFVSTLKDLGYVHQNADGKYELTFKILELSTKLANRFEIRKNASTFMRRLSAEFHETINLGFLDHCEVVHIDKIDSPELLRPDPEIGSRAPAQATALGKAILAFLPQEELTEFLHLVRWKTPTPTTCSGPGDLMQQLTLIRECGYATDNEELCLGLRCVAVPIFDHREYPRYAISISGPSMRMSAQRMKDMSRELLSVGHSLSRRLQQVGG